MVFKEGLRNYCASGLKIVCQETGIRDIVISGGVAQNIKANKKILEMDCVDSLYVPPGYGDESISIGAAFLGNAEKNKCIKRYSFNPYCGSQYSDKVIENFLKKDCQLIGNLREQTL